MASKGYFVRFPDSTSQEDTQKMASAIEVMFPGIEVLSLSDSDHRVAIVNIPDRVDPTQIATLYGCQIYEDGQFDLMS